MSSALIRSKQLSEPTVARLPIYQRITDEWIRRGNIRIDSDTLGQLAGVQSATVRRDLSGLGPLGTRGSGYECILLKSRIDEVLGLDKRYDIIVVGMGNLGRALVNSRNFLTGNARLVGVYDSDPAIVGTEVAGLVVRSIEEPLLPATVGVICTPAEFAQEVADRLVANNTHAMLNFAPKVVTVPIGTAVRYVDFSIELQILEYHLTNGTGPLGGGVLHTLGITAPGATANA
ncbi:MAG: redox-sensing transcriptional repressor Rex [Actinomycetota bacterium]